MKRTYKHVTTSLLIVLLLTAGTAAQTNAPEPVEPEYRHSLDFSPLEPLFHIYGIQYGYMMTPADEAIGAVMYQSIPYDFGRGHALAVVVGYRRYIIGNFHIEYQLWTSYNHFYEKNENKYYDGFEMWNEARVGYTINFTIAKLPCYINLQCLFGTGLIRGNKPQSFIDSEKKNKVFIAPVFFTGIRF